MCGIFGYIASDVHPFKKEDLEGSFNKLKPRGPDHSSLIEVNDYITLGFHRLSINDLSDSGNQPFQIDNISLVCNGEIYNYQELKSQFNFETISGSDCEIIIHLYKHFNGKIEDLFNTESAIIGPNTLNNNICKV
jgi:asparagine synthase (glutamine-hydrolysing)